MNCFALNTQHAPLHLDNVQGVVALELAIGGSLPNSFDAWPVSLADNWNTAAEQAIFDSCKTLGDMARAFLKWRAAELDRQLGAAEAPTISEDAPYSSRRSIHFFDNQEEAIRYRDDHGTGGWIFVCDDKGEATLFPHLMTPSTILLMGWTSSSGGRFIGASGKILQAEDVA